VRKLVVNKAVPKELNELPAKQCRQVVSAVLNLLADPYPQNSIALAGSPYRRIAAGAFRVVYRADEEPLPVAVAGKPNDGDEYRALEGTA
jgi:mRNA interferase RelE/StbE